MDLRQLRNVLAVIEHGSIGKAAEWLHVSQPAITKSIQRLEEQLQVPLFERGARGMQPTVFADCLETHARAITIGLAQALDEIKSLRTGGKGLVNIGAPAAITRELLPSIILQLERQYPDLHMRVLTQTDGLSALVQSGDLDFIVDVLPAPSPDAGLRQQHLFNDRLVLISRLGHPVARRGSASPIELEGVEWVLPAPGNLHRALLERLFAVEGLPAPKAKIECSNTEFIKSTVRQSDYIGLVANITLGPDRSRDGLAVVDIDSPLMVRAIGLVWREQAVLSAAVRLAMGAVEANLFKRQ